MCNFTENVEMRIKVNELFYSVQGESTFAGLPCIFIRLSGCNLRCAYCDTTYAYSKGALMSIETLINEVKSYDCDLVEITGGEPLIQEGTPKLINELLDKEYTVLLETNGSQDISRTDSRCVRIVDIKCPSSGESEKNYFENLNKLSPHDQVKFVIGDRSDYDYAKYIIENKIKVLPQVGNILFSTVYDQVEYRKLAEWILEDHLRVRLQIQSHKIIWGPNQRGV